jgi:cell wall-associated NlpC family hydrolase
LERGPANQASGGANVNCSEAQPGDLIFYQKPIGFVGTFQTSTDVIQVAEVPGYVKVYADIFRNSFYGPLINQCKRYWAKESVVSPTKPAQSPLPSLSYQQTKILACLANELGKPWEAGGSGNPGWFDAVLFWASGNCFGARRLESGTGRNAG